VRSAGWAKAAAAGAAAGLLLTGGIVVILIAFFGGTGFTGSCTGPGGPAYRAPSGKTYSGDAMDNARTITVTTARLGAPQRAAVIAVDTAMTESSLKNVDYGDRDSLGLFQQRSAWGSRAARENPKAATRMFLTGGHGGQPGLLDLPGWESMPIGAAAQAVQHSAFPGRYAARVSRARKFAQRYWPTKAPTDGNQAVLASYQSTGGGPSTGAGIAPGAGAIPCPGRGGMATGGKTTGHLPPGWKPPSNKQEATVVAFARAQLGDPYVWGANGPDAWDCSSLTQAAWRAAGVTIPRTTQGQQNTGAAVPGISAMKPGDLIFTPGSDGSASDPGHVGLYIGHGALIDAPHHGVPVQIEQVSDWASKIVAIRRPSANPGVNT
jgi:cell wall-associated NlpC family hydrolase